MKVASPQPIPPLEIKIMRANIPKPAKAPIKPSRIADFPPAILIKIPIIPGVIAKISNTSPDSKSVREFNINPNVPA